MSASQIPSSKYCQSPQGHERRERGTWADSDHHSEHVRIFSADSLPMQWFQNSLRVVKGPNAPSDYSLFLAFIIPYTMGKDSSRASKFGKPSSSLNRKILNYQGPLMGEICSIPYAPDVPSKKHVFWSNIPLNIPQKFTQVI
ncbi:hypothetical protein NPIL_590381 [Nephila pilipes]|uniref:Uncharacterized protein n=1 Tax=Nephila pilipes TaxID=299642 RepID=A0A8X6NP37_NEPPI|nr:hypothetical protein NPIL_590381 [Nephila pilipes]